MGNLVELPLPGYVRHTLRLRLNVGLEHNLNRYVGRFTLYITPCAHCPNLGTFCAVIFIRAVEAYRIILIMFICNLTTGCRRSLLLGQTGKRKQYKLARLVHLCNEIDLMRHARCHPSAMQNCQVHHCTR